MKASLRGYAAPEGSIRIQHAVDPDAPEAVEIQLFTDWPDNRLLADVTAFYRADKAAAVALVDALNGAFQRIEIATRHNTQSAIREALGIQESE